MTWMTEELLILTLSRYISWTVVNRVNTSDRQSTGCCQRYWFTDKYVFWLFKFLAPSIHKHQLRLSWHTHHRRAHTAPPPLEFPQCFFPPEVSIMISNIGIFQGAVSKIEIPVSWQHYENMNESLLCSPTKLRFTVTCDETIMAWKCAPALL